MGGLCLAVIPARGGSKRIPRKNVREFCGKPIIAYSIEAALESGLFDEVMVSTDDDEIAEVARSFGASVPFMRSAGNADDYATTADVLREVTSTYRVRGASYDLVCCIYATAPFVTAVRLREAYEALERSDADAACAVTAFGFPPQRAFVSRDGRLQYWMPEHANARSQDLEVLYQDAGQFYFYRNGSFDCGPSHRVGVTVDRMQVQDIDTEEDWRLAEAKFRLLEGVGGHEA